MKYLHFLIALSFALAGNQASAVTQSLGSLTGVATDQNIVVSSAAQDHVAASLTLSVGASNPTTPDGGTIRVRFTLIDQDGMSVTLALPSGGTGTELEMTRGVSYPTGDINSGLHYSSSEQFDAQLRPVSSTRLRAGEKYRVRVNVAIDEGSGYGPGTTYTQSTGQTIWHFTSTNPNDASPNVAVRLNDPATMTSNYIIRSVTGQSAFEVNISGKARRFDNFDASTPGSQTISLPLRVTLHDDTASTTVPIVSPNPIISVSIPEFVNGASKMPSEVTFNGAFQVRPQNFALITPMHSYRVTVDAGVPGEASFTMDSGADTAAAWWTALSGVMMFGDVVANFDQLSSDPGNDLNQSSDPGALAEGTITIPQGHGFIANHPTHTFYGPCEVKLMPNGDCVYISLLSKAVTGPSDDSETINGITVHRSGVTLSSNGARAGLFWFNLPRGLGYSAFAGTRRLKHRLQASNTDLNSDLLVSPYVTGSRYMALERLPLVFHVPSLTVDFSTGRISFTPDSCAFDTFGELGTLEYFSVGDPNHVPPIPPQIINPPGKLLHAGNDQVFRLARCNGTSTFQVSAGADGAAFIHSLRLTFAQGAYYTHFPRGLPIISSGGDVSNGQFVITDDEVTSNSSVRGVSSIAAFYDPNNPDEPGKPKCNSAPTEVARGGLAQPAGARLNFRPDGSLAADVTLGLGFAHLSWGIAKHSPLTYTHNMTLTNFGGSTGPGSLMIPSHFLPWRNPAQPQNSDPVQGGLADGNRTAALHLAGRNSTGAMAWEMPQHEDYSKGELDYAGINMRASDVANPTGITVLGGQDTPSYELLPESKFYLRQSGVSGVIQSNEDFSLPIYGMQMSLQGMKLSYLSNLNIDSLIKGGLDVGGAYPTNATHFHLDFHGLRLFSDGSLRRGDLDEGQGMKDLLYWNSQFKPLTMEFKQPDPCDASQALLALGVETKMLGLGTNETLKGVLGFVGSTGEIVGRVHEKNNFEITGIDSRLIMPGNILIKGPGTSNYTCTPVTGAYFNKWPGTNATGGFECIAGSVDVPFFENLNAHIHGEQRPPDTKPALFLMKAPDTLGPFTLTGFDPGNLGLPDIEPENSWALRVNHYRALDTYWLHAQKNWLGLLNFDYPMKWDQVTGQFSMPNNKDMELVIASAQSRVRSLTPSTADIKFTAKLGLTIPSINTNDLIGRVLDTAGVDYSTGSLDKDPVISALNSQIAHFDQVLRDIADFSEALADTPEKLVRGPIVQIIHEVRNPSPGGAPSALSDFRTLLKVKLAEKLTDVIPLGPNDPLPSKTTSYQHSAIEKIDKIIGVATTLRDYLVTAEKIGDLANAVSSVISGNTVVPDSAKAMTSKVKSVLQEVIDKGGKVRSTLSAIPLSISEAQWQAILEKALPDAAPGNAPTFVDPYPAKTDNEIADMVLREFLGDGSSALISEQMRIHLADLRDTMNAALDQLFGAVNEVLQYVPAGGPISYLPVPNVSEMRDLQFGKIDGYAQINGDSLHKLRLDADINIAAGSNFEMHGYVEFRDVTSDTPETACRHGQGVSAELVLGASTTAKIGAPPPPALTVTPSLIEAEAKFAFDNSGVMNGLSGRLGMTNNDGALFGILVVNQAEFGFGFGGGDAYLYGKGAGKTDLYDLEAALYFGRACQPYDVMKRVDPQAAELLDDPSFNNLLRPAQTEPPPEPVYGFYAFGYGAVSLNSLIGIPPTCMLNIKAGAGMGAFVFFRKNNLESHPVNENYFTALGLRQDFGASGEILCMADISARLSLIGAVPSSVEGITDLSGMIANASGLVGNGKAKVSATVGVSPFDFTLSKTLNMSFSYKPLKFDLDF